jgi:lysophospholipase L1-like esterase
MNIQPEAKVILCYGDSNTRGTAPDGSRYKADVRWTGQLQFLLGEGFYVIEEGLGGRTTDLEDSRPGKDGRNGLAYFKPCLLTHAPVDVLIIMLGTNDLKNIYDRSAEEVAVKVAEYCRIAQETASVRRLLIVSPSLITAVEPIEYYDQSSADKSHQLTAELKKVADETGAAFLDAAELVVTGEDGLHWDIDSHKSFAEAVKKMVETLA